MDEQKEERGGQESGDSLQQITNLRSVPFAPIYVFAISFFFYFYLVSILWFTQTKTKKALCSWE